MAAVALKPQVDESYDTHMRYVDKMTGWLKVT
jgi:hypothetical protein